MKNIKFKYAIVIWLLVFIVSIGASYAYFAYQVENTSAIVGNIVAIDADLTVELVVGSNEKMVPLNDDALPNAINGVGSPNGACIDSMNNLSCQVYKITLTNNGSRLKNLKGTVELYAKSGDGNAYQNLKWRELTNTTTVKDGSTINGMEISTLVSNLTMESKEERIWYIAVWISNIDSDQKNIDKGYFEGTVSFEVVEAILQDESGANVPNIVDGMIPIYYDETDGNWKKADKLNKKEDYKWFDYSDKQWANVVLLNSDTARTTYNDADLGTTINMDDVSAFYVWIPRYKYRVWSINRQACDSTNTATCEAKYAYPAFSTGIEIEFESGTGTTGNVSCEYNPTNNTDPTTLSDKCFYNGTEEITTTTDNTQFKDSKEAWYTHPAFTFGEGNEITGFWIGKFETTGSSSAPEIKPNSKTLVSQNVSAQFTTSKLFGTNATYGINNKGIDAHVLKNLEWGAVVYLSHSNYGLCNRTSCTGIYINNAYSSTSSIGITTGRSGGAIAGNTDTVQAHYPDSGTTSTNKYFDYGYYTYDGKIVNYDGTYTEYASDRTLGTNASTTGNIYGVYDMNGGAHEYVMANMYSIPTGTYKGPIGTSSSGFNGVNNSGTTLYSSGNSLLATVSSSSIALNAANLKYFDTYSYGTSNSVQTSWNRSRLGDATGEVASGNSTIIAWKPGSGVTGSISNFVYSSNAWFLRGGNCRDTYSGPFYFGSDNGLGVPSYSFRSSLS